MSELMNVLAGREDLRWRLLTTVSTLALIGFAYGVGRVEAADDDSDHPTVWIELGGQLERMDDGEQRFAPPFILATPRPSVETISPLSVARPLRYSNGAEGRISFEPDGSSWVFSASARFGRANGDKHVHQQTYTVPHLTTSGGHVYDNPFKNAAKFVDTKTQNDESDVVLDFQAGKDVGLGMFGSDGKSVLGFGVRYAQFSAKSHVAFGSDPDFHMSPKYPGASFLFPKPYHSNAAQLTATRSFRGVGPAISWNASAPIAGNAQAGEVTLDWGLNAAVLLGRQKTVEHHQTTVRYNHPRYNSHYIVYQHSTNHTRARSVTVPDLGGFAGLSFRYAIAKISLGYRGDFFFGAMDGGIDTAQKENRAFYGPFATISLGF